MRRGATLVELLVVVAVISILAAATWGALQRVTVLARASRTKATIAKIDHFIMLKLESYQTRRVPINTTGENPSDAATARLLAVYDLMRMEMPDNPQDIAGPQYSGLSAHRARAGVRQQGRAQQQRPNKDAMNSAKCLYLTVMTGNAEARQQFSQSEIALDPSDNMPYFIDGWQRPIAWIRWPAGCSMYLGGSQNPNALSDIQSGNPATDHDPFDPNDTQPTAFQLIPLIVSSAGNTISGGAYDYGVAFPSPGPSVYKNPWSTSAGALSGAIPIHNHHIEQK